MRPKTDVRGAAAAAAAIAVALFAARPTPTVPRLEPGFGKAAVAASLPPLPPPRDADDVVPNSPRDSDEALRDAPADSTPAARRTPRAGRAEPSLRPEPALAGAANHVPGSAAVGRGPDARSRPQAAPAAEVGKARAGAERLRGTPFSSAAPGSTSADGREYAAAPPAPRVRPSPGRRAAAGTQTRLAGGSAIAADAAPLVEAGSRTERESPLFASGKKSGPHRRTRGRRPEISRRRRPKGKNGRFRPLLLSNLLGPRALRPPPEGLEPPPAPDFPRPSRGPDGRALPAASAGLAALDGLDPADLPRDRRKGPHWDEDAFHAGDVRGMTREGEWLWLRRSGADWWAFADGGAQVRRDGVWWTKANGVWFVVHDGVPWARRSFQDWSASGLFDPASGTEMVYSRDFSRVALVAPGRGAEVFDAETGEKLADIPEASMPPRRRPRAPAELPLPSDVFAK